MLWPYTGYVALVAACLLGSLRPLLAAPPPAAAPATITTLPGDSMNLKVVDQINDHYVVIQVVPPAHNWFAGNFTNLPTDKETTIGLSMEGMDTPGNKADVKKWVGLRPVMTYADPTKYASYEWFQKDEHGRWVSGDVFKQGDAKFAGTGKVPEQTAIPKEVAEQFLSEDGTYWQPWREIDRAEAVTGLNIFRMTQRFAYPTATVAMRVPFTSTYQQEFMTRLRAAHIPGVFVDEIGETPGKRKLAVIRIEDANAPSNLQVVGFVKKWWVKGDVPDVRIPKPKDIARKPEIANLIVAREHATEHSSSWLVHGSVCSLLRQTSETTSRVKAIWAFVLIEDPDGSADSVFDAMTNEFWYHKGDRVFGDYTPIEAVAYVAYLRAYMNADIPFLLSTSFHGVECNEGPNIFSPFAVVTETDPTAQFNHRWFSSLKNEPIKCGDDGALDKGFVDARLYGWVGKFYKALPLAFEVNDRYPTNRLNLHRMYNLGASFIDAGSAYRTSPEGKQRVAVLYDYLDIRRVAMTQYYEQRKEFSTIDVPRVADMIGMGY